MRRVLIAVFLSLGFTTLAEEPPVPPPPRSKVFFSRQADAIDRFQDDPAAVRQMVNNLVMAVTGKRDLVEAWRSLVKPSDRVGIKISVTGGRLFSTHKSIVDAIVDGLESAGQPRAGVIVWDREDPRLAGYRKSAVGYQLRSIEPIRGYDASAVVSSPVLGKLIWGDLLFRKVAVKYSSKVLPETENLSSESHLAKILSREVTKVINVPVMSEAGSVGVAGCIYNMTIPNMDNWRRFAQSTSMGSSYLGEVYQDEQIAPKVVLHIMDGLIAQYAGGPEFAPQYAQHHATIYAGLDPVALDATVLREFEKWRAVAKLPPIGARADYLKSAAEAGIGNDSADRIDLESVSGW